MSRPATRTDLRSRRAVGLWAYPWDLADEGWDQALPRIAELGITTLRVAASYHSVQGYFPRNPKRPVLRADAAVYFSPEAALYAETPLRPRPSRLLPEIGELGDLTARARAEGLRVVAWTVCLHNATLAAAHPDAAQLDIFGQRHPAALCPANPDARAYVQALVRDLVRHQAVDGVELEAAHYASWLHHPHRKVAAPPDPVREQLLSLCVCQYCTAAAEAEGANVERLVDGARRAVTCPSGKVGGQLPSLEPLLRARRRVVTSLVAGVRAAATGTPISFFGPEDDTVTGIDWQAIGQQVEELELPAYVASSDDVRAIIRRRVAHSGLPAGRWTIGLSAGYPEVSSPGQLSRLVAVALSEGAAGLSFYNYGLIPASHLAWLAEAARLARGLPLEVAGA